MLVPSTTACSQMMSRSSRGSRKRWQTGSASSTVKASTLIKKKFVQCLVVKSYNLHTDSRHHAQVKEDITFAVAEDGYAQLSFNSGLLEAQQGEAEHAYEWSDQREAESKFSVRPSIEKKETTRVVRGGGIVNLCSSYLSMTVEEL